MKKTITFPSLKRCWLPALLALFYSLNLSALEPCNLVCNDHVNASMPADKCVRDFFPEDFLENPDPACTSYAVKLNYPYGTDKVSGDTSVNRSHIGYTFIYSVFDKSTKNSCWGYVTIEDKAAPQPLCKNAKVSCFQVARLTEIVGDVIDNCGQLGAAAIENLLWTEYGCTDPRGLGRVIRSIRTWDEWGNSSTCTDTLTIGRDSLENIKCPDLISLGCRVLCKKVDNTKSNSDKANFDLIQLSSVESNANYPTPAFLLKLQQRDTFGGGRKCVPAGLKVVPFISDSVLVVRAGTCYRVDSCVAMYPAPGGFCKTSLTWRDQVIPICGTGFKIRREWLINDWCSGRDTVCVQYIKVEDKENPVIKSDSKLYYSANTGPHDCFANVAIAALLVDDCDPNPKQEYIAEYDLGGHGGKIVILSGTLPATLKLPAIVSAKGGKVYHTVKVSISDACLNRTEAEITVKVKDVTPPNPVCIEYTQTTVDPSTCWARVYAEDLDHGSKDNCCDVLHFAVAHMDTIEFYRKQWTDYWNASCKSDYWNHKAYWDKWLERWINCFVFADYIDLSECGTNQVVLRVYEACGVPLYDPHVFPCSKHDWFAYNTWSMCRLWHNYKFFGVKTKDCDRGFGPVCAPTHWKPGTSPNFYTDYSPLYPGAETYAQSCDFYFPEEEVLVQVGNNTDGGNAPGNTCSARLYSDCMINILVDDKTLPVCQEPQDKLAFCDGVLGYQNEYANTACHDYDYSTVTTKDRATFGTLNDNIKDKTCVDKNGDPYKQIECSVENNSTEDIKDPTGKEYGWYGCSIYGPPSHGPNDHGPIIDLCGNTDSWTPIYCHSWLCLDKTDQAGKFDASTLFDTPEAHQGNPGSASAGEGKFYIWDNCTLPVITTTNDVYLDNCGNGWIRRTWTAKDKCENKIVCDQKIIVKHRSDFEVEFPKDLVINCDVKGSTSPDVTGKPIVMDDDCELVGVNYEDVRYDIVPDACYKIVRTWKLIDWCKYDPNAHDRNAEVIVDDRKVADTANRYCVYRHLKDEGDGYITYTQIIKVIDTEAPVVTTKDTTICLYTGTDADCTAPNLSIPFVATDNCTDASKITFRWELDQNASSADIAAKRYNKASIDLTKANVSAFTSTTIKDGTHLVHVIAEDNCGNEDTSTFVLIVKDCKKPTPYCYNGIATVLMPSTGEITVWASDLNAGSYDNCTPKASLNYSFDDEGLISSRTFKCADIPNGISVTIEVDIYVWDAAGNNDFCRTYLLIQDGNGNKCPDNTGAAGSIAGKITTESEEPVEKVAMNIKSSRPMSAYMTDIKGLYAFKGLPIPDSYTITPNRDDDPMNGVSTIDLVLIQKHILGVEPLRTAYKMIAADVDRNNDITVLDLVELRKLILTVYDKLPNNTSWRFVPRSYDFSKTNAPLQVSFPEQLNINDLSRDELNRDFVGIKVGDVNASSIPHSLLGAEAREAAGTLRFKSMDRHLKAGEEAIIDFTAENFNKIDGYQFSLSVAGLTVVDVYPGALKVTADNFGLTKLSNGYITTSWSDINATGQATTVKNGTTLFSVKVKATKELTLSDNLHINSRYTRAEAYASENANTTLLNVSLEFGNASNASLSNALYQNTPNPFKSQTVIGFELARSEKATITVTDVTGKTIKSYKVDGVKGVNRLVLNRGDFGSAGVLYYSIETKSFNDTKKMLLME